MFQGFGTLLDMLNCPWGWLEPSKMSFCEERICAWVVEPSNAWSSIAFVIVGAFLLWKPVSHKATYRHFGIIAILVGIFSFAFHGTGTEFFHTFDTGSMMLLSNSLLLFNLKRQDSIKNLTLPFVVLSAICFALTFFVHEMLGIYLFAAGVILALVLEYRIFRLRRPTNYGYYLGSLAIFAVAFGIWILDKKGIVCDPSNHLVTGHAVWHCLNALTFWTLAQFYSQFDSTIS